jgi:hypothetical protein
MTKGCILFAGCSNTATSGFTPENQPRYHWPHLLSQHYSCEHKNIAVGGMSNEEIFLRTVEEVTNNHYDLVIVQWTEIAREWVYFSDGNVDEWTNLSYAIPSGLNESDANIQLYAKLHYAYFNNMYMKIKKWVLLTLALENVLKSKGIPFIFFKGFGNYIEEFQQAEYKDGQGFTNLSDELKSMLDFKNRPDFYINKKLYVIKKLIDSMDNDKWIGLNSFSYNGNAVDLADDGDHAGPVSNQNLFLKLVEHIDSKYLTFTQQIL